MKFVAFHVLTHFLLISWSSSFSPTISSALYISSFTELISSPSSFSLLISSHLKNNPEITVRVSKNMKTVTRCASQFKLFNLLEIVFNFTTYLLSHSHSSAVLTTIEDTSIGIVVWNPWDKKAKALADFGDDEYKHMLCVEPAAIEKPITLKPGEEWRGRQELSAVPSSYCSGQLDPRRVLRGS